MRDGFKIESVNEMSSISFSESLTFVLKRDIFILKRV